MSEIYIEVECCFIDSIMRDYIQELLRYFNDESDLIKELNAEMLLADDISMPSVSIPEV